MSINKDIHLSSAFVRSVGRAVAGSIPQVAPEPNRVLDTPFRQADLTVLLEEGFVRHIRGEHLYGVAWDGTALMVTTDDVFPVFSIVSSGKTRGEYLGPLEYSEVIARVRGAGGSRKNVR